MIAGDEQYRGAGGSSSGSPPASLLVVPQPLTVKPSHPSHLNPHLGGPHSHPPRKYQCKMCPQVSPNNSSVLRINMHETGGHTGLSVFAFRNSFDPTVYVCVSHSRDTRLRARSSSLTYATRARPSTRAINIAINDVINNNARVGNAGKKRRFLMSSSPSLVVSREI